MSLSPSVIPLHPQFTFIRSRNPLDFLWSAWLKVFPSTWRAHVYKLLIRFAGNPDSWSFRLPIGLYAKLCWTSDEALSIEYVRMHTTIPVPRVLDLVPDTDNPRRPWLMLTTCMEGTPLVLEEGGNRLLHASDAQVALFTNTLSSWIQELRTLESPHGQRVCGLSGGPFRSFRISQEAEGPFDNVAQFHAQPFCTVWREYLDSASDDLKRLFAERPTRPYRIHFTHGDILPHNILADKNLRPTALLDWECAGWMPEYWEKAASLRSHFVRMLCWKDIVRDAFPRYEEDLAMEYQIQLGYDAL